MHPGKATHEQLKRHNLQMLLRSLYRELADSRASLAQMTGLTKPTVSNLIAELIDAGLVAERGQGPASESGGKRPRLLEFRSGSRQLIGIHVDHRQVTGVLTDLRGTIGARHRLHLDPTRPLELIGSVVDGLRAQLDAPLLCIGVGLPGEIDAERGRVRRSVPLAWTELPVAAPLAERYGVNVHVGHGTELSALAQYAFGNDVTGSPRRLVTLLIENGVEVGVSLERGAVHYGGDLSALKVNLSGLDRLGDLEIPIASRGPGGALLLSGTGEWEGEGESETHYLELRYAAGQGDARAQEQIERMAARLAPLTAWSIALLRPDRLSIAGPVTELGCGFLRLLRVATEEWLPAAEVESVEFALAQARQTGALGAVALALQRELALV